MVVDHRFVLIFGIITGSCTSSKVSQVPVKFGSSIMIPCMYADEHRNNVKYLCHGYNWNFCKNVVKTDKPDTSGKFSIFDDRRQRVFNVTIREVTFDDRDYWCNVERDGTDDGYRLQLFVTRGIPNLYVDDQEIQGFTGDDVTIRCYHSYGEMRWCKLGGPCVQGRWGMMDGKVVRVNSSVPGVFTVTLTEVTTQSSGWYMCVKGDLQMPVHVNVTDRLITTTCSSPTTTVESSSESNIDKFLSSSMDLIGFLIPLGLLILAVIVAVIVWYRFKKQSSRNPQRTATTQCEDTTYCNVGIRNRPSESSADVTYSSVVFAKPQNAKVVEPSNDFVTYSTLKNHKTSF